MRNQVSTVALQVLDDSEDTPNKNQAAGCVENVDMAVPGNKLSAGGRRRG